MTGSSTSVVQLRPIQGGFYLAIIFALMNLTFSWFSFDFLEKVREAIKEPPPKTFKVVKINFQKMAVDAPEGFEIDYGKPFSRKKKSGLQYGWSVDHTRNVVGEAGGTADAGLKLHEGEKWQLFLKQGKYNVIIGVGAKGVNTVNTLYVSIYPPSLSFYLHL